MTQEEIEKLKRDLSEIAMFDYIGTDDKLKGMITLSYSSREYDLRMVIVHNIQWYFDHLKEKNG